MNPNLIEERFPWEAETSQERKARLTENIRKRTNTLEHIRKCIAEQEERLKTATMPGIKENAKLCCEALYELRDRTEQYMSYDKELCKMQDEEMPIEEIFKKPEPPEMKDLFSEI